MYCIHDYCTNSDYYVHDKFDLECKLYDLFDINEHGIEDCIFNIISKLGNESIYDECEFLNIDIEEI